MMNYRNKVWLTDQYVKQKKSMGQIAEEFGFGSTTIETWLKKHNISRRKAQDRLREIKKLNKEWLTEQYINNKKSTYEIGKELGISWITINRYLDKFEIPKRTISENVRLEDDRLTKEWLTEQYIDNKRSMEDIAIELGAGKTTIKRYLIKFEIQIKTPYDYGRNVISSPHKNILIPHLENHKIVHITSHVLPKFKEQIATAHPYEIDEYLPDHNIFLDLYGDYWHNLDKSKRTDRKKKNLIRIYYPDFTYLVIWENEIKKDGINKLLDIINEQCL